MQTFKFLVEATGILCVFVAVVNFNYIWYYLHDFFRRKWSRWVDMTYNVKPFIRDGQISTYELFLLQMRVNSRTGRRKYRWQYIASSNDYRTLVEIGETIYPKLKIVGNDL